MAQNEVSGTFRTEIGVLIFGHAISNGASERLDSFLAHVLTQKVVFGTLNAFGNVEGVVLDTKIHFFHLDATIVLYVVSLFALNADIERGVDGTLLDLFLGIRHALLIVGQIVGTVALFAFGVGFVDEAILDCYLLAHVEVLQLLDSHFEVRENAQDFHVVRVSGDVVEHLVHEIVLVQNVSLLAFLTLNLGAV